MENRKKKCILYLICKGSLAVKSRRMHEKHFAADIQLH